MNTSKPKKTSPRREQCLKANRELQEQKRAEEKTPQRKQRMNANRKRHEHKRAEENTPQREQRYKRIGNFRRRFVLNSDTYSERTSNKS